jgi:hypothetical protein
VGQILETFKNKEDCNRVMVKRAHYEKGLTIFIVLLALAFMGSGITGFYGLEADYASNYCTDESQCVYSSCCALYGKEYGVCAQDYECETVYEASKEDDAVGAQYAPEEDADLATENYIAVSLGVILLLIIATVSYVEWHQGKPTKKKTRKRRKKKK